MAKKSNHRRCLLDTTAVVYQLHGHSLQRAAVRAAVAGMVPEVPVFVRMEYLRGVIVNLIEMWGLLRESVSVEDAFIDWSQKVRQERKLKAVLLTVPQWLAVHEGYDSKEMTLRRLGELIHRLVWGFDEAYPRPDADPLACVLGRTDIPRQSYDADSLLDFYVRFRSIQRGVPDCNLCGFRQNQRRRLKRKAIDPTGPEARQRHTNNQGFLRQVDALHEADATKEKTPRCSWCERLGDSIIALQTRRGVSLITADRTFTALGDLLRLSIVLLPSLAELKRRLAEQERGADESE